MSKDISTAVVRRLPRYYRYLDELMARGVERVSSGDLSDIMHITASQIRQDLNNFGGFGQQGYGYNVGILHDAIGKILGLKDQHNFIVIGAGHLGQALANYSSFEGLGFHLVGIFDVNKDIIGTMVRGIRVMDMEDLTFFLKENRVDIAALTVPKDHAREIAEKLLKEGVHGFWNFALVDLDLPEGAVVQNVHLSDSLMQLSYNMHEEN